MNRSAGCLWALVALFACVAFLTWRLTQTPQVGEDFAHLSPQLKAERRSEVRRLEDQIKDIGRAAHARRRQAFALVISEAQLNTLLQDNLRTDKSPLRDLRVGLNPGELVLQARLVYNGFDTTATARAALLLAAGRVRCDVTSLHIGGLPAPAAWQDKLEEPVTRVLNQQLAKAPGTLTGIELGSKTLTLRGRTH
jgi:hypothetical protein